MHRLIKLASEVALPKGSDPRNFWLGAVGVRKDGVIVSAKNGSVKVSDADGDGFSFPTAHAEYRCVKKMDMGGVVYVARVLRDGSLAMSKPCPDCERSLRSRGVKKVYYSINDAEYGVLEF